MMEWALRERLERRRQVAALTIQRCFRNFMAPVFVARQKIMVRLLSPRFAYACVCVFDCVCLCMPVCV